MGLKKQDTKPWVLRTCHIWMFLCQSKQRIRAHDSLLTGLMGSETKAQKVIQLNITILIILNTDKEVELLERTQTILVMMF